MPTKIPLVYDKVAEYVLAIGDGDIAKRQGLSHYKINDNWECWINPHKEPLKTEQGYEVNFGELYVEWNKFPAGVLTLDTDCGFFAAGSLANEDSFIAAVEQAITEVK